MQRRDVCLVALLCLSFAPFARAQAAGAAGSRPPYKPKNLKVLPDNTDLRKVMRQYSDDLGVDCEFCHAPRDPVTHREDRASDANPKKDVARYMIRMTDDINAKYLAELEKNEHGAQEGSAMVQNGTAKVDCGTCHRGHEKPEAFVPPPHQEHERERPAVAPPSGAPATPPSGL